MTLRVCYEDYHGPIEGTKQHSKNRPMSSHPRRPCRAKGLSQTSSIVSSVRSSLHDQAPLRQYRLAVAATFFTQPNATASQQSLLAAMTSPIQLRATHATHTTYATTKHKNYLMQTCTHIPRSLCLPFAK